MLASNTQIRFRRRITYLYIFKFFSPIETPSHNFSFWTAAVRLRLCAVGLPHHHRSSKCTRKILRSQSLKYVCVHIYHSTIYFTAFQTDINCARVRARLLDSANDTESRFGKKKKKERKKKYDRRVHEIVKYWLEKLFTIYTKFTHIHEFFRFWFRARVFVPSLHATAAEYTSFRSLFKLKHVMAVVIACRLHRLLILFTLFLYIPSYSSSDYGDFMKQRVALSPP